MADARVRVLVLTLHTDEPQLERCVDAVRSQRGIAVEQDVISGLGNVEAHRTLYDAIERRAREYDLFVKVDADMVLLGEDALSRVGSLFSAEPELDHAQLAVLDHYTDRPIMGVHAFSPRVSWPETEERLFVDPAPVVPGRRMVVWDPPAPIAVHSPDPTPLQAFCFGVHRGLKAFQPGRGRLRGSQAREQWRVLTWTWEAFLRHGDAPRGLAVFGGDLVWRGLIDQPGQGYHSEAVERAFERAPHTPEELRAELAPRWASRIARAGRRAHAVGARGMARIVAAGVRQDVESRRGRGR